MFNTNDKLALNELADGNIAADTESGIVLRHGKVVRAPANPKQYVRVLLPNGKQIGAHRIIVLAAHGHIKPGLVVNHRNKNRHDNRLTNLELVTPRMNALHANGSLEYPRIRPEDVDAVDPAWLAEMLTRAANGDPPPERGSGPADIWVTGKNRRRYAIWH